MNALLERGLGVFCSYFRENLVETKMVEKRCAFFGVISSAGRKLTKKPHGIGNPNFFGKDVKSLIRDFS